MTKFHYKKIDGSELDPGILGPARRMLEYCKEILRLSPGVHIQWVRAVDKNIYELDNSLMRFQELLGKPGGNSSGPKKIYDDFRSEFWGRCFSKSSLRKNEIEMRADISLKDILHTIAHECQHLRDHMDHRYEETLNPRLEYDKWEKRADEFADKALKEFGGQGELAAAFSELNKALRQLGEAFE